MVRLADDEYNGRIDISEAIVVEDTHKSQGMAVAKLASAHNVGMRLSSFFPAFTFRYPFACYFLLYSYNLIFVEFTLCPALIPIDHTLVPDLDLISLPVCTPTLCYLTRFCLDRKHHG